jgi:hypothetical protein
MGASGVKSDFSQGIATKRVCESLNGAGWRSIGAHSCAITAYMRSRRAPLRSRRG